MSHRRIPFTLLGVMAAALLLVLAPGASAKSRDRNHDRIPDRWETAHHLSLKVNQAARDQDHDGLKNRGEYKAGTDPRDADTDNDGVEDGAEDSGKVVSFDGTTLVVKLDRNDKTVEGKVDGQTEIACEDHSASTRSGGDGDHGSRGDDHGDDDHPSTAAPQGAGDDQGDDNDSAAEDDQGENEVEHAQPASCGPDQLKPGTVVHEAELRTTADGLVFDEIKLAAAAPAA